MCHKTSDQRMGETGRSFHGKFFEHMCSNSAFLKGGWSAFNLRTHNYAKKTNSMALGLHQCRQLGLPDPSAEELYSQVG